MLNIRGTKISAQSNNICILGYNEKFDLSSIRRLNMEMGGNIDLSNFEIKNELVVKSSETQCSYVNVWMEAKHNCVFDISKYELVVKSSKTKCSYINVCMEATHKCVFDISKYGY